jgi:hypothetical protein
LATPNPANKILADLLCLVARSSQRFLLSPKWSILLNTDAAHRHPLQLPGNTLMYTTSNDYSDHYISFIGFRIHEKEKGAGYFRSQSKKKGAVSLKP